MKHNRKPAKASRTLPLAGPLKKLGGVFARHRSVFLVMLCAAAVVLTMGAPAALFAVSDELRFARAETAGNPYQSRTVEGDDLYLVRALKERSEAEIASIASYEAGGQNDTTLYLGGQENDLSQMQYSSMLAPHCETVLTGLQESGTIDENWLVEILDAAVSDPYNFYGVSDTMGFLTFGYFPNRMQEAQRMSMTVESRTGKMVSLQLLVSTPIDPPNPEQLLRAWMEQNDLDILGDWTVPVGTRWETSGLYSARGGLLATCVTALDETTGSYALSLDLVPCTEEQMQAATLPGEDSDATISDDQLYTGQMVRISNALFNEGSSLLFPFRNDFTGEIFLYRLDYASMDTAPVCTKEGCTHQGEGCAAWVCQSDGGTAVYPFAEGNQCYVIVLTSDNTEAQVFALDGSQHRQLATVSGQGMLDPLGAGNGKLYLIGYQNENLVGCEPAHILAVDLQTGEVTATPALLSADDQVVGCFGGCLVLVQNTSPRADRIGQKYSQYWGFLYQLLRQDGNLRVVLLDPATGARRLVSYLSGNQLNLGKRYTADEWLFSVNAVQYSSDNYVSSIQNDLAFVLNLRNGTLTEMTFSLEDVSDPAVYSIGEICPLSSLAGENGAFSKDLLAVSGDRAGSDLLLNPESGTLQPCTPCLESADWYPCAVTENGELIVLNTASPATIFGKVRLEDLVLIGADGVIPMNYY